MAWLVLLVKKDKNRSAILYSLIDSGPVSKIYRPCESLGNLFRMIQEHKSITFSTMLSPVSCQTEYLWRGGAAILDFSLLTYDFCTAFRNNGLEVYVVLKLYEIETVQKYCATKLDFFLLPGDSLGQIDHVENW